MNKKKILMLLVSVVLIIGVITLITVVASSTMETAETEVEADTGEDGEKTDVASASSDIEAAEKLIGETVSREEVQDSLGEWEKFEMSSNGCERGVYAGRFYYGDYIIFSRTYDKGKTFHIISVNE